MSHALARAAPVTFIPEKPAPRLPLKPLRVVSEYQPAGDQPAAIAQLLGGIQAGERDQVLLGVTGSGKTFTMAKVIEHIQRPTLVLAPNKTLAAQLYSEMKSFFPDNAVEYFVSYYDYYQPEAYVPRSDTYIEKDSAINETIDRMRHAATQALLERSDVIIVASVSCIYGIGSVETYSKMVVRLETGGRIDRDTLAKALVDLQYRRNDVAFARGSFRLRGEIVDIFPSQYEDRAWRVSLFGDEIEKILEFDRRADGGAGKHQHLRQQPLRHAAADADAGGLPHQGGAEGHARPVCDRRQIAGGGAAAAAHDLRYRDDGNHRRLQRDRELFPLSIRPQCGGAAAHLVRISAGQCAAGGG